ncbi:MAG: hypothetical protein LBB59_00200 [Campylobacteraceae bacterium]|nr:hypothetical protein [Campylobacteraceae bacterium]
MPRIIPTKEAKTESIHAITTVINIHSDAFVMLHEIYAPYAVTPNETKNKTAAAALMIKDAAPNPECFFFSISKSCPQFMELKVYHNRTFMFVNFVILPHTDK